MSNNILSRVQILMDANTASYEQNIKKAGQESTKTFGDIREEAMKMGKIVAAGAATAGIALGAMALDAAKNALEIDKMAKTAGVSTQSLIVLRQAGRAFGIETDTVAGAVGDLNEKIFEAAAGNKDSANAFKALGVQVTDVKGNMRTAGDVIKDVANKFSTMSDGATKTAIASRLGGDGFKELIPVLNQGAAGLNAAELSAKQLGNTLSTDTIAQLQSLRADVGLVTNSVEGFSNQLLTGLAPVLVAVSGGLKTVAGDVSSTNTAIGTIAASVGITSESVIGDLNDMMNEWVDFTTLVKKSAVFVAATVETLRSGTDQNAMLLQEWETLDQQNFARRDAIKHSAALGKIEALNAQNRADAAAKEKRSGVVGATLVGLDSAQPDKGVKKAADDAAQAAKKLEQGFAQQQSTLQKTIATAGLSTNLATTQYELTSGALKNLLPMQKAELEILAKRADFAQQSIKTAAEITDLDHQIAVLGKHVGLERTLYELETGKYKDLIPARREQLLQSQKHLIVMQNYQSLLGNIQTDEEKRATTLGDQLDTLKEARSLGLISASDMSKNVASSLASGFKLPEFGGIDATVAGPQGELNKANAAGKTLDTAFETELKIQRALMTQGKIDQQEYFDSILKIQQNYAKERKNVDESIATAQSAIGQQNLVNASAVMGSLMEITATFADENSATYRAMFLAQKAISIATSIMAIQTAMAQASWSLPFPANLGAMAIVAAQTASIVSTIASVAMPAGIAHGGLDYVPKEATYLLDEGERVLSPRQNEDFTRMMASDQRIKDVQTRNSESSGSANLNQTVHMVTFTDHRELEKYLSSNASDAVFVNKAKRMSTSLNQVLGRG